MNAYARALLSIALGTLATPVIYVLAGIFLPSGFHDLRNASAMVLLVAFGTTWLFSLIATFGLGTLFWSVLHRFNYDGYLSYSAIAIGGLLAFHFGIRAEGSPTLGAIMAVANASTVRMVELMLKSRAVK